MSNEQPVLKTRISLLVAAIVAVLALGAGTVLAQQGTISDARAREIALRAVPGEVMEIEREDDEIEVVIRARDGSLKEVELDARTGRVLEIEDEDEDEDGEENEGEDDDDDD